MCPNEKPMGVIEELERLQSTALEDCLLFSCVFADTVRASRK